MKRKERSLAGSKGDVARRRGAHIFFTFVSFVTDFVIRFWHPVLENRWNDILMVGATGRATKRGKSEVGGFAILVAPDFGCV
jgi:hypothetical protein